MRNAKKCPKCQSSDIIRVPGSGSQVRGNYIWIGQSVFSRPAKVGRYVCASCGFLEAWVDDLRDIIRIRQRYTSWLGRLGWRDSA